MTEENALLLDQNNNALGEIVIAPEVVEVVIGIAASKVEGVYSMRGNLATGVTELFGRAAHGKGVYLKVAEDGIRVDIYCYLTYGVAVPKVAIAIQEKVKQQVLFMTDIDLAEVNIHVVGMVPERLEKPDFSELFEMDDNDDEE